MSSPWQNWIETHIGRTCTTCHYYQPPPYDLNTYACACGAEDAITPPADTDATKCANWTPKEEKAK